MKIKKKIQKPNNKKFIIGAILLLVVLLFGVGTYISVTHLVSKESTKRPVGDASINRDPPTNEESEAGQTTKNSTINNYDKAQSGESLEQSNVTLTITAISTSGASLEIRTLIDSLWPDGTCKLTLTNDYQTKTYSSTITAYSSFSSCDGFSIPKSELSNGTWSAILTASYQTYETSTSKTITI